MNKKILVISFVLLFFVIGAVSAENSTDCTLKVQDSNDEFSIDENVINEDISSTNDVKVIYVNDTGDDSNTGTVNSPYSSIGKAISEVNSSENTTIYLSRGTFAKENDVNFQFTKKVNTYFANSNVTFIGESPDLTVIDGQSAFKFMTVTSINTNLIFKNITFINFRGAGGSIFSLSSTKGNLIFDNCVFKNSYSTNNGGAISLDTGLDFNVTNSQFINCFGGAIVSDGAQLYLENNTFLNITKASSGVAVYSGNRATIKNNKFINLTCGDSNLKDASIYVSSSSQFKPPIISDNTFINCINPSNTYTTVYVWGVKYNSIPGTVIFERNKFINSTNSLGAIYSNFPLNTINMSMSDEKIYITNNEVNNGLDFIINMSDDIGNVVIGCSVGVKFSDDNGNVTYYANIRNDNDYSLRYINLGILKSGIYNVSLVSGDYESNVITTAEVNVFNEELEFWVDPSGSDASNGSQKNPFKTIQHAIDVGFEKTYTVVIHLAPGTYSGDENTNLVIANRGSLKLLGEKYNETVIDGGNTNWILRVSTCNVYVENLTLKNGAGSGHVISGQSLHLKNCIIDNNTALKNQYVLYQSSFDGLTYINNEGSIYYYSTTKLNITDLYFVNNNGEFLIYYRDVNLTNSKFINNTCENGVVYGYGGSLISKNNYYANNTGNSHGVFATQPLICENDKFINNVATSQMNSNGGVGTFSGSKVINCIFINNSADYKYGVGVFSGSKVINCTFIDNSASMGGVGLIGDDSSFSNCKFINNTAQKGGVFVLEIVSLSNSKPLEYKPVTFNNVTFENNGEDIYLTLPSYYSEYYNYYYPIFLNITFNNAYFNSTSGNLTAKVETSFNATIGGSKLNFILGDMLVGSSELINGAATFEYVGLKNGQTVLSGNLFAPSVLNTINDGIINVEIAGMVDHIDYWVSNSGSDENGDGSQNNPFKTIQFAVDKGYEKTRDIVIYLDEEVYSGANNTNLTLTSLANITLVGKGIGKTIFDGENINYFANILLGENQVKIHDLTIINMTPDNRFDLPIGSSSPSGMHSIIQPGSVSPIHVENGGTLYLNNVNITSCHGGEDIIGGSGNILINNSILYKNGIASGLISASKLVIDNSIIDQNLVAGTPIIGKNIIINNTKIIDVFNIIRNGYYLISGGSIDGSAIIENSIILNNNWENPMAMLGIEEYDNQICPASVISSYNTTVINSSFTNEFEIVYPWSSTTDYSWHTIFSGTNVNVYNSSFSGYSYITFAPRGTMNKIYIFDGCSFEGGIVILDTLTKNCVYSFTNSVFISCDNWVRGNKKAGLNSEFSFENNYWGNNSNPIVPNNGGAGVVPLPVPTSWIILTSEGDEPVFKLTDGENVTDYTGSLPAKISYVADENGDVIPVVNIAGTGYKFSVDENASVVLNTSAPMKNIVPKVLADVTLFADDITTILNGGSKFSANFTDKWGDALANTKVQFIIGDKVINETTDANGTASFDIDLALGAHIVTITNPSTGEATFKTINVITEDTTFASNVDATYNDGSKFSAKFTDEFGVPLANTKVAFKVGANTINATTDANGTASFVIDFAAGVYNVTATNPVTGQVVTNAVVVTVDETIIAGDVNATYADASKFSAKFTDEFGAPLANTNVTFKVGTNDIKAITDANGTASFAIDFNAGSYNVTATNPVTGQAVTKSVIVSPLATKLSASKLTMVYNTGKYLKATLKDANGKALANQNVTIKINGKTYNRVTNADGQVSLKITLAVKNAYTATITYKGTTNYLKSSASAKVVVKKATPKLTAKKKVTFKAKIKTKKLTVTLKDNKGKVMKKVKVTIKVGKKTYKAKTNAKGKATFKITKLTKKGKYTAKVKFAGNKNFKAVTKSVKVTVKK